jgi:threonine aldolase
MEWIDLRSDTVTQPTPEMRKAMAAAVVGDDVFGEDPTINRLQDLAAEITGKEAGLFVTSGTMGNLSAVLAHCNRGDEVILGNLCHTFLFEAGGISALGGIHPYVLPNQVDGTLLLNEVKNAIRKDDVHFPLSRLVMLENTHNRCGGVVLNEQYTNDLAILAHTNGLQVHLDGARIFNAAASLGVPVGVLTKPVDSVTFCLSKGLCAPVGSVLCGTKEFIQKARRIRKQLGGGMRQAGILAAAGIVALLNMTGRLVDDHNRAKEMAADLAETGGLVLDTGSPFTNMIFLNLEDSIPFDAKYIAEQFKKKGVLVGITGERRFRFVTHYWVDDAAVHHVIKAWQEIYRDLL